MNRAVSRVCRWTVAATLAVLVASPLLAAAAFEAPEPIRAVLSASRRATLSSEVGLVVKTIHKQMGEPFEKGEAILEFDARVPDANIEAARAALRAAQASYEAVSSMFTRKNASRVDLEIAKRESTLAETKLRLGEYELEACVIRAPFSGRIEQILVNEHELVGRGEKLLLIVDDTVLRAQFLVPEEDYRKIAIGDRVQLLIHATGEETEATLTHIAAVFDPASQTFDAWADVDNSSGKLRAGMNAMVLDISPRE